MISTVDVGRVLAPGIFSTRQIVSGSRKTSNPAGPQSRIRPETRLNSCEFSYSYTDSDVAVRLNSCEVGRHGRRRLPATGLLD